MFPSKEKRLAKWSATRQKGKRRFIIVNGALGWGVVTAVLVSLGTWLVIPGIKLERTLLIALVTFPLAGLLWGWLVWNITEREFSHHEQSKTS
jgi:hypothetical protein